MHNLFRSAHTDICRLITLVQDEGCELEVAEESLQCIGFQALLLAETAFKQASVLRQKKDPTQEHLNIDAVLKTITLYG